MSATLSQSISHPTWMEINNQQLLTNWQTIRQHIGKRLFCLPVKANAYGHGLVEISALAEKSKLIDYLGVSCSDEAVLLRKAGNSLPILVFGAIHQQQLPDLLAANADITISSLDKARMLYDYCRQKKKQARIHLEIETGMNRTGMRPLTALKVLEYLKQDDIKKHLQLLGLYTHLACAGNGPGEISVAEQMHHFSQLKKNLTELDSRTLLHAANSGGIMFYPETWQDMQMVRPGILAYGLFDLEHQPKLFPTIASAVSLKSKISYFKVVAAGEGVSYGHTYRTSKQTRIVTIPIGYGDGYMRCMSHKAEVLIRGKRYPVVGNINMDQIMVDIGNNEAYVGDEVVLIGKQGKEEISVFDLARWAGTITYEIMCAFSQRVPRVYL